MVYYDFLQNIVCFFLTILKLLLTFIENFLALSYGQIFTSSWFVIRCSLDSFDYNDSRNSTRLTTVTLFDQKVVPLIVPSLFHLLLLQSCMFLDYWSWWIAFSCPCNFKNILSHSLRNHIDIVHGIESFWLICYTFGNCLWKLLYIFLSKSFTVDNSEHTEKYCQNNHKLETSFINLWNIRQNAYRM